MLMEFYYDANYTSMETSTIIRYYIVKNLEHNLAKSNTVVL